MSTFLFSPLLMDIAPGASVMTDYGNIVRLMHEIQRLEKAPDMDTSLSI